MKKAALVIVCLVMSNAIYSQSNLSKKQAFEHVVKSMKDANYIEYTNEIKVISKKSKKSEITIEGYREGEFLVIPHYKYIYLELNELQEVEKVKSNEYGSTIILHFKKELKIKNKYDGGSKKNESYETDSIEIDFGPSKDIDEFIKVLNVFIND